MEIGARYLGAGMCRFRVWAPFSKSVSVLLPDEALEIPMSRDDSGYWICDAGDVFPGARYLYRLDGSIDRPDPASRFQPEGVHGPSRVLDHDYGWHDDDWAGIPLDKMVIYELHTGTFTEEGTFDAILPRIDELLDLGITALEIMPVGQFPGERNWGYDGVYPFAVQSSSGGPKSFKGLVDACHSKGMAFVLDVVYNHLGPEGNYFSDFGPYFTDRYKTLWGSAVNFDGPYSDEVRDFYFENAFSWFLDYHVDALRLDAVHAIYDMSAKHFLRDLAERVEDFSKSNRKRYLIAESDLNDARVVEAREKGGYGIDAQWCDDLHHSIHALLTGERRGYYEDFGRIEDIAKALRDGFVYSWTYSRYRKRHFGSSSGDIPAERLVVFTQNHDQVGNRPFGERLSILVSFEALKLAAGAVMLSPYVPLIFMGEEHADESPFLYFTSHSDLKLIEAVRAGRKTEFNYKSDLPDPQDQETFIRSRIDWKSRYNGRHRVMLDFYRRLICLRKEIPALRTLCKSCTEVLALQGIIVLKRRHDHGWVMCVMNFNKVDIKFNLELDRVWKKILDSSVADWNGPGPYMPDCIKQAERFHIRPLSFVLYESEDLD